MVIAAIKTEDDEVWDGTVPEGDKGNERMKFKQERGFQEFRVFWGRGEPFDAPPQDGSKLNLEKRLYAGAGSMLIGEGTGDAEPLFTSGRDLKRHVDAKFQFGDPDCVCGCTCCVPGWFKDFVYYSSNNHPLHGIFSCSPVHRLGRCERIAMEIGAICFCFVTSMLRYDFVHEEKFGPVLGNKYVFSLLIVTIPSTIFWWIHWYCFTFPCGMQDGSKTGCLACCRMGCCTVLYGFSTLMGYALTAAGVAFVIWEMSTLKGDGARSSMEFRKMTALVAYSRFSSYFVSWAYMLGTYYNPFIAWGEPCPTKEAGLIAGTICIGFWRIQKQRFQNQCIDALEQAIQAKEKKPPPPEKTLFQTFMSP